MSSQVTILLKRSNTAGNDAYTGSLGEITMDTQARKLRIHDGALEGGYVVANMSDVQSVIDIIDGLAIEDIAGLDAALQAIESDISDLQDDVSDLQGDKADKTVTITAGDGLTGGGDISANRTVTLGTPGTLTGATTNAVTADSHTHAITVTKSDVGLGNVDNTSDANKPISSATQSALDDKVDKVAGKGLSQEDFTTTLKNKLDGVESGAQVNTVDSVAGKTGVVTLVKGDVGLGNVDNTADADKPVSTAAQAALDLKANLDSPALTGTPTAPTAAAATNTTQVATTAFVTAAIDALDTGVSDVQGTAPIQVSGGATKTISIDEATTSVKGAMSSADKTKLDGIAAGAQVNTVDSVAGKTGAVTLNKSDVGLGNVDNTADADKPISTATQTALDGKLNSSLKGANDGLAELDSSGKLKTAQLPDLAITEFLGEVATEQALLALSGQRGDWAVRTDTGTVWIVIDEPSSSIENWRELSYPVSAVTSVNTQTGAVVLEKSDVGLGSVDNYATATQAQAITGTANDLFVTPLRVREFVEGGTYTIDGGTF